MPGAPVLAHMGARPSGVATLVAALVAMSTPEQRRVAMFLLVGGVGIVSNLAGMLVLRSLGDSIASVGGACVGVLSNFVLHCRLTFRDRLALRSGLMTYARLFTEFCMSSAVAVAAQLLAAHGLREAGLHAAVSQFCGILCGTLINFVAQNFLVFRAPKVKTEEDATTDDDAQTV